jgi:hypothetical protein
VTPGEVDPRDSRAPSEPQDISRLQGGKW